MGAVSVDIFGRFSIFGDTGDGIRVGSVRL